jgi:hypothetical protein
LCSMRYWLRRLRRAISSTRTETMLTRTAFDSHGNE